MVSDRAALIMSDQLFTYVYDGGVMVAFGQNRRIVQVRTGEHGERSTLIKNA